MSKANGAVKRPSGKRPSVKRVYAAAVAAGMKVEKIEVEPTGKIILIATNDRGEKPEVGNGTDIIL